MMDKKSSGDLGTRPVDRVASVEKGSVIDLDEQRLRAQGHKAELERSFSWLGAISLAYRFVSSETQELFRAHTDLDFLAVYRTRG
jgi:choline transport protein